jgi:hypothetical protein
MSDSDTVPAHVTAAEIMAEEFDEPVENFLPDDDTEIPSRDDLESIPEDEWTDNDLDPF